MSTTENITNDGSGPILVEDRTSDARARIYKTVDNSKMAAEVIEALDQRGGLYQHAGRMVEVLPFAGAETRDGKTREVVRYSIVPVTEARLRLLITRACVLLKPPDEVGKAATETSIPRTLPADVLAHEYPFPVLAGIAESPTIRPDGTLITEPGYDPASKIYLATDLKVDIPEHPTREDALAARDKLLDVISDFAWAEGCPGESVVLSGLISTVARPAIDGPVPMHAISATVRGAGKGRVVEVASVIATGEIPDMQPYPTRDEKEVQKILLSVALQGAPLLVWDNVVGDFGCASLDSSLTATQISGRVLGKSEMAGKNKAPVFRAVQWATGNQMSPTGDLARRMMIATIDPRHEHPEEREGPTPGAKWKYPDLIGHARQHRGELLGAVLTIVRAYLAAGCPEQPMRQMDFIAWSRVIRGAIIWCGMRDPAETALAARASDRTLERNRLLIDAWPYMNGGAARVQDLVEAATIDPRSEWAEVLEEFHPAAKYGDLRAEILGKILRQVKGSIIGQYRIVQPAVPEGQKAPKVARWCRIYASDPIPVQTPPVLRKGVPDLPPEATARRNQGSTIEVALDRHDNSPVAPATSLLDYVH